MSHSFDVSRFVEAQDPVYSTVLAELRSGRKVTHWMWFVFPQLAGLGASPMSKRYAISGLAEARAYLAHPVLGARLRECAEALLVHRDRSARDILGTPDDLKLHSSATLFQLATGDPLFAALLARFFGGEPDAATVRLVADAREHNER